MAGGDHFVTKVSNDAAGSGAISVDGGSRLGFRKDLHLVSQIGDSSKGSRTPKGTEGQEDPGAEEGLAWGSSWEELTKRTVGDVITPLWVFFLWGGGYFAWATGVDASADMFSPTIRGFSLQSARLRVSS